MAKRKATRSGEEKQRRRTRKKGELRAFWSGTISFGMINIPVRLYTAVRPRELNLDMLRRDDLCPIAFARVCRATGEEVPYKDITKGYEYQKGDYVVLEEEDLEKANPKRTQTIDVRSFANQDEIDPKYYERPLYVEPGKGANKPYALLHAALKKSKKVAICKFVLRTKEYLGALRAEGNAIVLMQMRFDEELKDPDDLALPTEEEVSSKELDVAMQLVESLTEPFEPKRYKDTWRRELEEIIEAKAHGKRPHAKTTAPRATPVPNLMAALRASLKKRANAHANGDE